MTDRYLYLSSGAIGEALLGIHIGRTLTKNVPDAILEVLSPRSNPFVRELMAEVPFITYREMRKSTLVGWLALFHLARYRYRSVVLETVTVPLPLWWRIILWSARRHGGVQLRYQMTGHERAIPLETRRLAYVCQTENYFDAPVRILAGWGIEAKCTPYPELPHKPPSREGPYMVFHFFAANYRRSIPSDHARAILEEARTRYPNHEFILTCAGSEGDRATRMAQGIGRTQVVSNASASDILALLSGADMVIGTASGIIFMAAQLGRPTVALSCLIYACWLPVYAPSTTILAARAECNCNGDGTGECQIDTPDGAVFRCLYFISTPDVIEAMASYIIPGASQ